MENCFTTKDIKLVNFLIKEKNELIRISSVEDEEGKRKFKFKRDEKIIDDFRFYKNNREKILNLRNKDVTSKDIQIVSSIIKLMYHLQNGYELVGTEPDRHNPKNRIVFKIAKGL
ncbi:MAG: hypothetical protein ACRC28_00920 [Clostridium sp.]|uniref:hypothetical protein n=1 Tax=Clostridia TaxID=186801 RepID=UPI003F409870